MDTETPSFAIQQEASPTVISRPTVPPKPKSTGSFKGEGTGSRSPEVNTSTVGTQVNLLSKRKTRESGKNSGLPQSEISDTTTTAVTSETKSQDLRDLIKSPTPVGNKPALPPKPSPASLSSPKKSLSSTSVPTSENNNQTTGGLLSPIKPPKCHAPYASIDEIENLSNPNSPPSESQTTSQNKTDNILSPCLPLSSINPRPILSSRFGSFQQTKHVFQYPNTVSPQRGLSPSQRVQAQRKSASLGRNTLFSPLTTSTSATSSFSRVTHLDLTTNSRLPSRMLSHQSFGGTSNPLSPPPPPPRQRRSSHKPQSSPLDISLRQSLLNALPLSPTSTLPVYAVIDKEKKWEMRRLRKEGEKLTNNNNNLLLRESSNNNETELSADIMSLDVRNRDSASGVEISGVNMDIEIPSSLSLSPVPKSWLGKYIAKDSEGIVLEVDDQDEVFTKTLEHETPNLEALPNAERCTSDPLGRNESFLFHHLNSSDIVVESLETESSGEEDETKVEPPTVQNIDAETGINYEPPLLSTEIFESDEKVKNANLVEPTEVKENENLIIHPSQNEDEFEGLVSESSVLPHGAEKTEKCSLKESGRESIPKFEDNFEKILEEKVQSLFLQGVTNSQTSTDDVEETSKNSSDADLVSEIIRSQEQFKSPSRKPDTVGEVERIEKSKTVTISSVEPERALLPPLLSSGSFRRRSWTCSENTTSSFTESSPSSSSSSSLRERPCSISGSMNSHTTWMDEGELSTGALGDAENSDVCQGGSVEDFSPSSCRTEGISSFSRRRRLVNTFFASFGRTGGSSNSNQSSARKAVMRVPQSGRRKEKSRSHFFLESVHPPQKVKKVKSEVYYGTKVGVTGRVSLGNVVSPLSQTILKTTVSLPHVSSSEQVKGLETTVNRRPLSHAGGDSIVSILTPEDSEETSFRSRCHDDILSGLNHKERQAFYVAREILTSERTFVDVLNLLTIDFPHSIKSAEERIGHTIISKMDLDFILGGLPNLKLVNEALLYELEKRIASWKSNPKVSDIIIKTGPFLKHYSMYIRDYQKISNRFEHIREKNVHFGRTVAEFEKQEKCRSLQLKHYMLKPVQRMPQYALLLGDYLKNLNSKEHEDYEGTVKAISIVKEVAEHGNEAIRRQENAEKLVQLQNRLTQNVILKADRQLICEGELRKVCRKELQPRYFALMSDCLLCMNYAGSGAATGTKEFKLRYELPLTGMRVALATSEDYQNEFSVISVTRSFNLVAKTPRERDDWLKTLTIAIKNNIKKRAGSAQEVDKELTQTGKVAPVWIADSRVTMCQSCTAEFTMTFRRHHCRACGKVVCGNCSGNEAPIQYQNFEAARVCDDCYTYLLEEFDQVNQQNSQEEVETIRSRFKKGTPNISKRATKHKRSIPNRLEIHGNISGSAMSGYLHWKEHRKAWKKQWFVLIDRVLFVYAASEDIAAIRGIPILGYQVELVSGGTGESMEGDEGARSIFQLTHSGQEPYIFQAESSSSAEKWIAAMQEATVLK